MRETFGSYVVRVPQQHAAGAADTHLGPREIAVLDALVQNAGRVVYREQLRRDAGLDELHVRRCESVLVDIRRALGPEALVTVRRRGWRLSPDGVALAMAIVSSLG